MKKILNKKNIFSFVLGAVIFGCIGVVSAYAIFANEISYSPIDSDWEVENVQTAIDDLQGMCSKKLDFERYAFNDSYGNSVSSRTVQVTLPVGKYIVMAEFNRAWNGPASNVSRDITSIGVPITCSKECTSNNVANYIYGNRGTQVGANNNYVKYIAYTSIYYVQVLTDDTTITTTFNTDASNVAPSNVDISAIKINA